MYSSCKMQCLTWLTFSADNNSSWQHRLCASDFYVRGSYASPPPFSLSPPPAKAHLWLIAGFRHKLSSELMADVLHVLVSFCALGVRRLATPVAVIVNSGWMICIPATCFFARQSEVGRRTDECWISVQTCSTFGYFFLFAFPAGSGQTCFGME